MRKIIRLAIVMALVLAICGALPAAAESRTANYDRAMGLLMNQQDTASLNEAAELFATMGTYQSSPQLRAYAMALIALQNNDLNTANTQLNRLNAASGFADVLSAAYLPSTNELLRYVQARMLESSGETTEALKIYNELFVLDAFERGTALAAGGTAQTPVPAQSKAEQPQKDLPHYTLAQDFGDYYRTATTEKRSNLVNLDILGIEFMRIDGSFSIPADARDVSEAGNGKVLAWIDSQHILRIASDGIIDAPSNSYGLFELFYNVQFIRFNDCFDTHNVTRMSCLFFECLSLKELDVSCFDTSNVTGMGWMFVDCENLTTLDVSGFNTGNVTDMALMFTGCRKLNKLDVSGFDTRNVNDMAWMFSDCENLTTLDVSGFDTGNVTNMSIMFNNCWNLNKLDVSGFNTRNVTDMDNIFSGCYQLGLTEADVGKPSGNKSGKSATPAQSNAAQTPKELPYYTLSRFFSDQYRNSEILGIEFMRSDGSFPIPADAVDVSDSGNGSILAWIDSERVLRVASDGVIIAPTSCAGLFNGFSSVQFIRFNDCFDTRFVTNMGFMFYQCSNLTELDVSGFDTGNVMDMQVMFADCQNLTVLDVSSFNTDNVTNMNSMFYGCGSLNELDLSEFHTGKVKDMSYMFCNCTKLYKLNLNGFDTSKVVDMSSMFASCLNLSTLDVSGFDTQNVTNMSSMFVQCIKLSTLDVSRFDTRNVADISTMFLQCRELSALDVSGFDTRNVTEMSDMFAGCNQLGLTEADVGKPSGNKGGSQGNYVSGVDTVAFIPQFDFLGVKCSKVSTKRYEIIFDLENLTNKTLVSFDLEYGWGNDADVGGTTQTINVSIAPGKHKKLPKLYLSAEDKSDTLYATISNPVFADGSTDDGWSKTTFFYF